MKKALIAITGLFLLASCVQSSNGVYSGLYTSWKDRDPISRVDNNVPPIKKGTACSSNILMLAAFGDSSIEAAKREGQITKVSFVDRTYKGFVLYLPLFQEGCTVVYGN